MHEHEWKSFVRWFDRSRLRRYARLGLFFAVVAGVVVMVSYAIDTGMADTYTCNGRPATEMEYQDTPLDCDRHSRGASAEWDFMILAKFALVGVALFLLPLLNGGVLMLRAQHIKWRDSEVRKLRRENRDHRARVQEAEKLSAKAENEAARLQRELDRMLA